MVWVGKDLKAHPVSTPCHGQGHLPPDQVAPSPVQPSPEHCQGWGIYHFSGHPVPAPHHPHREELVPKSSSQSPLWQVKAIPPCPVPTGPCPKPLSRFPVAPSGTGAALRFPWSLLFSRWNDLVNELSHALQATLFPHGDSWEPRVIPI